MISASLQSVKLIFIKLKCPKYRQTIILVNKFINLSLNFNYLQIRNIPFLQWTWRSTQIFVHLILYFHLYSLNYNSNIMWTLMVSFNEFMSHNVSDKLILLPWTKLFHDREKASHWKKVLSMQWNFRHDQRVEIFFGYHLTTHGCPKQSQKTNTVTRKPYLKSNRSRTTSMHKFLSLYGTISVTIQNFTLLPYVTQIFEC